ncbi:putative Uncharacterized protein C45G9.7 [Hypsibius exemplaris]|uniref:PDZ domain-containing protein n=1 Tax=Hypsibius exemplaris TaxID=2072580 RepID=A0A1W0X0U9_HYPEX|nr:putative Uncharacterized protein C45G9.7 [Hypsibius exemplaris]
MTEFMAALEDEAFHHIPGIPMEVESIPVRIEKETVIDENGEERTRCGFRIGGGIDQDPQKSPHGYTDQGIYVTKIHSDTPADGSALRVHDKLLQVNGHDFTMVTHKQACDYIAKYPVLNILVVRKS